MTGMTVPEAARYTGKNPETIRRWIREGKLQSVKVGNQHLVLREHVDLLMPVPAMALPPGWGPDDTLGIDWAMVIRESRDSR